MNELDKYHQSLKILEEKFGKYTEVDNRVEEKIDVWNKDDYLICINNNFIKDNSSHGSKEGLTFGKVYQIVSKNEIDMVFIKNDDNEVVPYLIWRFYKYNFSVLN